MLLLGVVIMSNQLWPPIILVVFAVGELIYGVWWAFQRWGQRSENRKRTK